MFGQVRARVRDLTRATEQLATASKPGSAKQAPSPLRFPAFRLGQPSGVKLRAVRAPVAAAERPDPGLPAGVVAQVRAAPVHLPVRRRRQRRWLRRVAVAAAAAVVVAGIGILIPPERSNVPQLATVPTRAPAASIPARPTTAAAPIQEPPEPAPLQTAEPLPHPISTPLVASAKRGSLEPPSQPGVQTKHGAAVALPQEAIGPGTMPADPVLSMPRPPAPPITATERLPIQSGRAAAGPVAQEEGSGAVPVPQATAQSRATPEPVPPIARPAASVVDPHRAPPLVAATLGRSRGIVRRRRGCSSITPPAAIRTLPGRGPWPSGCGAKGSRLSPCDACRSPSGLAACATTSSTTALRHAGWPTFPVRSPGLAESGRRWTSATIGRSPARARWRSGLKADDGREPDRRSAATRPWKPEGAGAVN